jgi:hypothetical protein
VLLGGLGNQLFGMQFAKFLEHKTNDDVRISSALTTQSFTNHGVGIHELDILGQKPIRGLSLQSRLRISYVSRMASFLKPDLYCKSEMMHITQFTAPGYIDEYNFSLDFSSHIYVGLFQSYRYALEVSIEIQNITSIDKFKNDFVALHIRHGDYLSLRDTFGVLWVRYYEDAIIRQLDVGSFQTIRVYGSDGNLSRTLVNELKSRFPKLRFEIRTSSDPRAAVSDLLELSQHQRHIISNSTFAWWGAWLARAEHVVAPSKWFRNLPDPNELIPPSWMLCDSTWI